MAARYEVDLSNLTFGELMEVVRQGVEWGISINEPIDVRSDDAAAPTALVITRPDESVRGRLIVEDAVVLDRLAQALDDVVESEGDARSQVVDLTEARDLLRGVEPS